MSHNIARKRKLQQECHKAVWYYSFLQHYIKHETISGIELILLIAKRSATNYSPTIIYFVWLCRLCGCVACMVVSPVWFGTCVAESPVWLSYLPGCVACVAVSPVWLCHPCGCVACVAVSPVWLCRLCGCVICVAESSAWRVVGVVESPLWLCRLCDGGPPADGWAPAADTGASCVVMSPVWGGAAFCQMSACSWHWCRSQLSRCHNSGSPSRRSTPPPATPHHPLLHSTAPCPA